MAATGGMEKTATVGWRFNSPDTNALGDAVMFESPASEAVIAAEKPSPSDGGPCETCAFRSGTEANRTEHTLLLAKLCVEGMTPFSCHEKPQLCRGYIAAMNLNGVPKTEDELRFQKTAALAAEMLSDAIARGVEADLLAQEQPANAKAGARRGARSKLSLLAAQRRPFL